jgi:hypothetical protein
MANEIKQHPVFIHYAADAEGNIYSLKAGKIKLMAKVPHGRGYHQFGIRMYGRTYMYLAHRFVYECFNGVIQQGMQCHHIDHDKHNNSLDNLKIVDQLENMKCGKEAGVLYGGANPKHPNYPY